MNKYSVLVLMSTYNGEKYLKPQIDSILNQKDVDVFLTIRDDGSTDKTRQILSKYAEKFSNINCLLEDNLGVRSSFKKLVLLAEGKYDFYAFADQDDLWDEDKLITAISKLKNESVPSLYFCNQICFDEFNNKRFIRFKNHVSAPNLLQTVFKNEFSGCTFVFNGLLLKKAKLIFELLVDIDIMHDTVLMLIAQSIGKIIYDKTAHMTFIRHGNNVTEATEFKEMTLKRKCSSIKKQISTFFNPGRKKNCVSKTCGIIYNNFSHDINENAIDELKIVSNYRKSIFSFFKLLKNNKWFPRPKIATYAKIIFHHL